MHCWHQKVTVEPAYPEDSYGDVYVDTNKPYKVYKDWLAMTRPQTHRPDGLRRPLWTIRPYRPATTAFKKQAANSQRLVRRGMGTLALPQRRELRAHGNLKPSPRPRVQL